MVGDERGKRGVRGLRRALIPGARRRIPPPEPQVTQPTLRSGEGSYLYFTMGGTFVSLVDPSVVEQGALAGEAILGEWISPTLGEGIVERLPPESIRVNRVFVEFLHRVIERWAPEGPGFEAEVRRQRDGWIYIIDGRTPTPQGDVPPEDIIGAFEVRGGKLVAGSYRPSTSHRIVSNGGLFRLDENLHERLLWELERRCDG